MYGYNAVLGFFVWPLIFCAVIGYVYLKQQSFVAAAVAAMIIIAVYGNYIANMDIWLSLMYILIALAVTALFLIFLSKRRQ
jgi:hypothetical protein